MDPESNPPKEKPDARALALRRLTLREYSSVELVGYLRRKGVSEAEALTVARECEERGLINPDRYAAVIARSQIARGKGPMAVLAKLKRRGLPADFARAKRLYEAEAPSIDGISAEVDAVRQVLLSRFPNLDHRDRKAVARAYRAMLSRGFSPSAVRSALDLLK